MIYIVRHGETDYNREGRLQGQLDISLNENGINQAKTLKKSLSSLHFKKIYSSTLKRAKLTAEIISNNQGIIFDDRLNEIYLGSWQGQRYEYLKEQDEKYRLFYDNPKLVSNGSHEDYTQVISRIDDFFHSLNFNNKDDNILVVSHGFVMFHYFKNKFVDFKPIDNCEIILFDNTKDTVMRNWISNE